jgi:protein-tyrosine phosphatase
MGNICRSPIAENVFRHRARERKVEHLFEIDSAGTGGWHAGESPDPRACRVAAKHGVAMSGTARQITRNDFMQFDLLLCMDIENYEHLIGMGAPRERLRLLLECDRAATCRDVPDPYYGGSDGFETVFRLVDSACEALLEELLAASNRSSRTPHDAIDTHEHQ